MTIHLSDSTNYFMASDAESLQQSALDLVLESHLSAGTLQLRFYKLANGSVIWLLKNQIDALHSGSCPSQ
jgi:hypothetical protein